MTAIQKEAFPVAGLMYAKVNDLRAVCHRRSLSKPVTLRATDSGVQNARRSFETSTRAGKRSETGYLEDSVSGASGGSVAHHTTRFKLPHRDKKDLRSEGIPVYGYSAPAKSGAGIGVLVMIKATHDAPSVFFCAVNPTHAFFSDTGIIRAAHEIMVGWMGASSEAPVSLIAGYANPVQSTTSKIGVFGGGVKTTIKEAAKWLLPPPKIRNLSGLSPLFAAICRQLPQKSTISPQNPSRKPAVHWHAITSPFLLGVSVRRWLMRNYFRVTGYAVNKRGLTVGIHYEITASRARESMSHAMLQAQREGLSHVRITRTQGVAA
ncbi:ash family protein [Klebsiella pneumoniae]|uniref:ash family protein n=1 Tax=Klebsiella pneumoniae TaxID=573 RepID=UPI0013EF429F